MCPTLCDSTDCSPPGLCPWISQARILLGFNFLLQGIFLTKGSKSISGTGRYFTFETPGKPSLNETHFILEFCHGPIALETKQLIANLKTADTYSSSILRFPLAFKVKRREKEYHRIEKDFAQQHSQLHAAPILQLSQRSTMRPCLNHNPGNLKIPLEK